MADNKDKIISIQVNAAQALEQIAKLRGSMDDLKGKQKELDEAYKAGTMTQQEYGKATAELQVKMKKYRSDVQVLERQLVNQQKAQDANTGSLVQMRAELNNLTRAYDELSEADRRGGIGENLQRKINEVTTALKEAEAETQRFTRNVGNYEGAVDKLIATQVPFLKQLTRMGMVTPNLGKAFTNLGGTLKSAGTALGALSKQLLALLANPIVATIAAIVGAFMALKAVFDKMMDTIRGNEEQYARLQQVLAPLRVLADQLTRVFERLGDVFLSVATRAVNIITAFTDLIGITRNLNAETKKYIALEQDKYRAQQESRRAAVAAAEANVDIAKMEREVAELRAAAADKEKNTAAERVKYLEQAIEVEKRIAQIRRDIAVREAQQALEEARILEEEAARTKNATEMEEKLNAARVKAAEAQANIERANTALAQSVRSLTRELQRYKAEVEAEAKAEEEAARQRAASAANAAKNAAEQRAAAARRAADDTARAEAERIRTLEAASDREREILRKAEDEMVKLIADAYDRRRAEINTSFDREIADIQRRLQTEANLTEAARDGLQRTAQALEQRRAMELAKIDIDAAKAKAEEVKKIYERESKDLKALFDARVAQARIDDENVVAIEVERKAAELESLHKLEEESEAEFYARKLTAQADYNAAKKALIDYEVQMQVGQMEATAEVVAGVGKIIQAFGDESETAAKAAKVVALAEIAINTGAALAKGIAAANSVPYPANLIAMATTVATILANIAMAISTVKGAKFAQGGLVRGAGSGTSDSVPAMLSNGESVMTARTTELFAPLLSALNQAGGGRALEGVRPAENAGEAMMARAFAAALSAMPAPVVSVKEITDVQGRVAALDEVF